MLNFSSWIGASLDPIRLRQAILALPTERAIALARLVLAATILIALWINPPRDAGAALAATGIAVGYSAFALFAIATSFYRANLAIYLAQHLIDIGTTSSLTYLADTSTFFMLFTFSLVVGLLRWNWRGALASSGLVAFAILLVPADFQNTPEGLKLMNSDLSAAVLRGGFVVVCGAMLAYLGAHRERGRRRFAQLASWPSSGISSTEPTSIAESLKHSAMVLQIPRLLVVYDELEEPDRHTLLWSNGSLTESVVSPETYGTLVAESHQDQEFFAGPELTNLLVDADLRADFQISSTATAPILTGACQGRVFLLDRSNWLEEDMPVLRIIASRLGIELHDRILRRDLEVALAARERGRVGRDLHDGTLQGLAAASIQLKVLSDQLPQELRPTLAVIRETLATESQRIREFVDRTRAPLSESSIALGPALAKRAESLSSQWSCEVHVGLAQPETQVRSGTMSHLLFIVDESVSNAVRHGGAKHVNLQLSNEGHLVRLQVTDDGCGLPDATGLRPLSLASRIEELGGSLSVTSSDSGTALSIELPT
jgi:signal transduction histidine kinase